MRRYIFALVFLFTAGLAAGQGWERVYPGLGQDVANAIAATPDGGFVLAGYYNAANSIYLLKTDPEGDLQWKKTYTGKSGNAIVVTRDSGYAIAGYINGANGQRDAYLLKTDAAGTLVWTKNLGLANDDELTGLIELTDGSLVMVGYSADAGDKTDLRILKTNSNGVLQWSKTFGQPGVEENGYGITIASNGDIAVVGRRKDPPLVIDTYVVRVDASGNKVWEQSYDINDLDDLGRAIIATPKGFVIAGYSTAVISGRAGLLMEIGNDGNALPFWFKLYPETDFNGLAADKKGGFFATGLKDVTPQQGDLYIVHTDAEGDIIWEALAGKGGPDQGYGIVATADGGAAAAGSTQTFINTFEESPYLVKTDGLGQIFTSYISGFVFDDENLNCLFDGTETGKEDWIVQIENSKFSRYVAANSDGKFLLPVDTGTYKVQLFAPNEYWTACDAVTTVAIPNFYDTVVTLIPVRVQTGCPRNEVDVATPLLHRCQENVYTIRYCNSGTAPSVGTRVEVTMDPYLSVTGSSIPWAQQQGTKYTFNVGVLDEGKCGSFTITAFLDCNTVANQAHCVEAHIFPDTLCNVPSNWRIQASATCDGVNNLSVLSVKNVGLAPQTQPLGFIVVEDIVLLTQPGDPDYQFDGLMPGESKDVWMQPANGKTLRVIADQNPDYYALLGPKTTAAVEGCVSSPTDTFSTGFYTMFPEDYATAYISKHCQENKETDYNPTFLKRGHPKGYDVKHYVSPETDLDYLIRFSNTGTDTVHHVIIRDTLSPALDPGTVYPGAASHPYDFEVYGNGIVQFTIPNLNLVPGSSANEGFVKFRISQKPNLPCETKILNSAAISFDFQAPVVTNRTEHTICERDSFLTLDTKYIHYPGADLKVYPNPFTESTQFELTGVAASEYLLEIYDTQGRKIFNRFYNHPTFRLFKHQLPSGVFFYRLAAQGKPVASGKIQVH